MTRVLVHSPYSLKSRGGSHIGFSGGSRGGPPLPPIVLDQTEARRAEKIFWKPAPSLILGLNDPPPPPFLQEVVKILLVASPLV